MDEMGSIRDMIFEAKTTDRMDELLGEMAEARALELPDMQQGPPGKTLCFGSVVVDPARERVLLRRSANPDRNVFGWTFSKGQPQEVAPERAGFLRSEWLPEGGGCAGEAELPEKLILRIALRYWVVEAVEEITQPDRPDRRMSRGEVVQWFSWGEAEDAIRANASRGADLLVLEAARQVIKQIGADGK
jgi:hypothetical protein